MTTTTSASQWEPAAATSASLEAVGAHHHHPHLHHHHHQQQQQQLYHNALPPPVLNPPEAHYSQAPLHSGGYQTAPVTTSAGSSAPALHTAGSAQPYYANYTTQPMYAQELPYETQPKSKGSLDFVHKLFTMLEEPGYSGIVRWSAAGDSFVVLDTAEFTKTVLPRHFKHSNFASFVRQLNKYDFHKVRLTSGAENPYGENVWEFKHPEFRIDNRDQLDTIKRKTPMTRRVVVSQSTTPDGPRKDSELSLLRAEVDELRAAHKELAARQAQLEADHRAALDRIALLQETQRSRDEYLQQIGHFLRSSGYPVADDKTSEPDRSDRRRTSSSATQASVERPPPPPWDAGKAFSVLLVEDDETSVRICLKFLRQYGCDVDVANDGLDAVARAQAAQYDLILMDVVIPSLDGLSATEIIRSNKASSSATPIIAMAESDSDFKAYFDRGVSGVLTKPFNKDTMYSMLDSFLRPSK